MLRRLRLCRRIRLFRPEEAYSAEIVEDHLEFS